MIPRGILREPVSSLRRADIFILTKSNLVSDTQNVRQMLNKVNPAAEIFEATHAPVGFYSMDNEDTLIPGASLVRKAVMVFSGIGDPDSFESLIRSQGLDIGLSLRFTDHHNYSKGDLGRIINCAQEKKLDTIITTEKDAVRLKTLISCNLVPQGTRILVFKIKLIIKNEEEFISRLLRIYNS
jgi:tetraacyldisaccharide 4'-kinase